MNLLPLAPATLRQTDALRGTLRRASALAFYEGKIALGGDPVATLARLPLFDPARTNDLAGEMLTVDDEPGAVELTSGTVSGRPKRRVLAPGDVEADAALLAALLRLAGVRRGDRVAAIDLTAGPLTVAFLEGCERLGAWEAVALGVTGPEDAAPLLRLRPDVLLSPPGLLARLVPALVASGVVPRLAVYNGDRLAGNAACTLAGAGCTPRSLYGLTETSALGVECGQGTGVHLAPTHAFHELRPLDTGSDAELIVTTLGFAMPLLRYPTGDRVCALTGTCSCGSRWPRVEILGRLGDRFSLHDLKFTPDEFAVLLLDTSSSAIQIVLDNDVSGRERMTFRLPADHPPEEEMRERLQGHALLGYPLNSGLVRVEFEPLPRLEGRKLPRLLDRRGEAMRDEL